MRHTIWPIALGVVALVTSCGQPVCVMGLGDCTKMFSNAPTSTSGSGSITVNAPSNQTTFSISQHQTSPTFTATGGNGTYNWTVTAGGCGTFSTTSIGTLIISTAATLCTVQVTDTSSPTANYGTLNITVTN